MHISPMRDPPPLLTLSKILRIFEPKARVVIDFLQLQLAALGSKILPASVLQQYVLDCISVSCTTTT